MKMPLPLYRKGRRWPSPPSRSLRLRVALPVSGRVTASPLPDHHSIGQARTCSSIVSGKDGVQVHLSLLDRTSFPSRHLPRASRDPVVKVLARVQG